MKLRLIAVGKGAPAWADDAVADYGQRLRRFGGLDETLVRPEPFRGDVDAVRQAEATRILALVKDRDRLVALDERGLSPDTEAFAALVKDGLAAQGSLVFAIGGPYGHGEEVRRRAWKTVRLSSLVLNHQVARVVLFEQVYRAFTLLHGEPYHH